MHFEGVPQIGIESEIQLRQPHCHAAADADYILAMVDGRSMAVAR